MLNWKVRFSNPVFWAQLIVAVFAPILVQLGIAWGDITSWSALGGVLLQAIGNPVIVVAIIVSVWNAINDPTTAGLSDSTQALTYTKPKISE